MLEKIVGVLLGVIGVTTTVVQPPALPKAATPRATAPVVETIAKIATTTIIGNTKTKPIDTRPKVATKSQPKKTEVKAPPKITAPVVAKTTPVSKTTPSPAVPDPLGAFNLKLEPIILPPPPPDWNAINQKTREATVNILCTSKYGGSFEPLSGSGVIIDPRGIILTNAHVAQYLLLGNYRVRDFLTCVARTGSPATPKYTLKLLYISQRWLQENYKSITSQKPVGTGENDYALLQITGSTNPEIRLPATFPSIATDGDENNINTNDPTLLASYPAGFLGGIAIQRELYAASTLVSIGRRYTFRGGTLDAFSLGGSPVAQHGSSGGGAISGAGKLLGIIVTSTDAEDTSKRDLDAISVAHINRSLLAETGFTLDTLFASSISTFGTIFDEEVLPNNKKLLIDELDSKNR